MFFSDNPMTDVYGANLYNRYLAQQHRAPHAHTRLLAQGTANQPAVAWPSDEPASATLCCQSILVGGDPAHHITPSESKIPICRASSTVNWVVCYNDPMGLSNGYIHLEWQEYVSLWVVAGWQRGALKRPPRRQGLGCTHWLSSHMLPTKEERLGLEEILFTLTQKNQKWKKKGPTQQQCEHGLHWRACGV